MKNFSRFFCLILMFAAFSVYAQEATESQTVNLEDEQILHYGHQTISEVIMQEISAEEDDLDARVDVKPLDIEISSVEKQQKNITDFTQISADNELSPLSCEDESLNRQVRDFIYNYVSEKKTNSVIEKRNRLLLVKNLRRLEEIGPQEEKDIKDFATKATMVQLRINTRRPIYKLCSSKGNAVGKFGNVYVIIYVDGNYYKVIVPNLIEVMEKPEEATFIYNWQ